MVVFDHIIDNIYIGDQKSVKEDIDVIINLSSHRDRVVGKKKYYEIPLDDCTSSHCNLSNVFDKINYILAKHKEERILIHCYAGISRSPTVVLYYLMKYRDLSLKEAYVYLRSRRRTQETSPNFGFFRQLLEHEKMIRGKSSMTIGDYFSLNHIYDRHQTICRTTNQ